MDEQNTYTESATEKENETPELFLSFTMTKKEIRRKYTAAQSPLLRLLISMFIFFACFISKAYYESTGILEEALVWYLSPAILISLTVYLLSRGTREMIAKPRIETLRLKDGVLEYSTEMNGKEHRYYRLSCPHVDSLYSDGLLVYFTLDGLIFAIPTRVVPEGVDLSDHLKLPVIPGAKKPQVDPIKSPTANKGYGTVTMIFGELALSLYLLASGTLDLRISFSAVALSLISVLLVVFPKLCKKRINLRALIITLIIFFTSLGAALEALFILLYVM